MGQTIELSTSGTDKIFDDGPDVESLTSAGAIGDFVSVTCFEAGRWLVDRSFGFSS